MPRDRRPRGVVDDPPPPPDNYPESWIAHSDPAPVQRDPRFNPIMTGVLLMLVGLALLIIIWPR